MEISGNGVPYRPVCAVEVVRIEVEAVQVGCTGAVDELLFLARVVVCAMEVKLSGAGHCTK